MKVVTVEEMRAIERRSEAAGVSMAVLMEHAGRSAADEAVALLGEPRAKHVLVLVGPGNNGGDGLVAARHLRDAGAQVALYLVSRDVTRDGHYETARQRCIPILRAEDDGCQEALRQELAATDLVIDALLGTGRARPVAGVLKAVLDTVNVRPAGMSLLAVDLPTGLNADTGTVDESALRADVTIALGFPKVGLLAFPGASHVGRLVVGDIGLPQGLADDVRTELTTPEEVSALLPARAMDSHKGSFGKVMVAGGSINYVGAPVLGASAAGRVGAGLVTLACAASLHPIFAAKLTEATFFPLPDDDGAKAALGTPLQRGILGAGVAGGLLAELAGYDVLLLGPGLGRAETTQQLVQMVLDGLRDGESERATRISCVVDADGLNALAAKRDWPALLPKRVVLTPHSGEMARLMAVDIAAVNANRLAVAREAAMRSNAVVVLKGAHTIIATPDGRVHFNPSANSALATAGTGDVLAGAIAGLLAQGLAPYEAAVAGVFLHSQAGKIASAQLGDAGVLAGDLLPLLPRAIRELKALRQRDV